MCECVACPCGGQVKLRLQLKLLLSSVWCSKSEILAPAEVDAVHPEPPRLRTLSFPALTHLPSESRLAGSGTRCRGNRGHHRAGTACDPRTNTARVVRLQAGRIGWGAVRAAHSHRPSCYVVHVWWNGRARQHAGAASAPQKNSARTAKFGEYNTLGPTWPDMTLWMMDLGRPCSHDDSSRKTGQQGAIASK